MFVTITDICSDASVLSCFVCLFVCNLWYFVCFFLDVFFNVLSYLCGFCIVSFEIRFGHTKRYSTKNSPSLLYKPSKQSKANTNTHKHDKTYEKRTKQHIEKHMAVPLNKCEDTKKSNTITDPMPTYFV